MKREAVIRAAQEFAAGAPAGEVSEGDRMTEMCECSNCGAEVDTSFRSQCDECGGVVDA